MRFVEKSQLPLLTNKNLDELPMAKKMEEDQFSPADLPRKFQKVFIRVYTRDPNKSDLVNHVFNQWLEEKTSNLNTVMLVEASNMVSSAVTPPAPSTKHGAYFT